MKKLLIVLIVVFSALFLLGCDGKEISEETVTPTEPEIEEQTETAPPHETAIEGTEYYVSVSGNDTNPGTMDAPFKTFAKAVSVVKPGDTVYVTEGIYKERLIIDKSGADDALITFMAYPGDEVTIDGDGMEFGTWGGLIHIDRESYIKISGFNVINSSAMGIFACDSVHITIDNNYVYNAFAPGIHCWGDTHLTIDSNTLEWTCNEENAPLECIATRNTNYFTISNNHVFNSGAIGICLGEGFNNGEVFNNEVNDTLLGIYVGGWDKHGHNTDVYNNICHNNRTGIAVNIENGGHTDNIRIYNNITYENIRDGFNVGWGGVFEATHTVSDIIFDSNISYGNGGCGFQIMGVHNGSVDNVLLINNLSYNNNNAGIYINGAAKDPLKYSITNISIINNTVVNNGNEEDWVTGGIYISNPDTTTSVMENIIVKNNIVSQNKKFSIAVWKHGMQPDGVIIKANLIDGYLDDMHRYGETKGYDFVLGDPKFADAANDDFHLMGDSRAIDAGTAEDAPAEDFDGTARPQGAGIDIGAYEYK